MSLSTLTAADIQPLSASVVNKIAAGEVIERPASVVKELLENSIDAGATRVDVSVEQGGLALLRVSDNGHGIPPAQLPLAVTSHATSKIRSADDLFQISTLGFRGEALASIAEISRLVLRSRPAGAAAGAELEVTGGQMSDVAPCGCPEGTTLEVHNLFYNTPVRRKFLRSTQTEMGHISEAFTRIALAHSHLHCTLRHNDRVVYDLAPTDDRRERVRAFFGPELADDLIAVASEDGEVRLEGYVASPTHSRANARLQYLFLNGRAIRDRSLQHALSEAYRGLLLTGRYPIAFLNISMPADQVDVNVHPTKLEVRFQESGRLYSQLLGTLRTKFLTTDLTARLETRGDSEAAQAHDPERAQAVRRDLVEWAKGSFETPVTHIPVRVDDDAVRWDVTHTLVVGTQTINSPDLVERLRTRAADSPHRYTIICPRSGDLTREQVTERLARTLAELYKAEIDATGQPMSPEPFAAVVNAIEHYRIDEIVISTFAGSKSKWLEEGLVERVKERSPDKPVEHFEVGGDDSTTTNREPAAVAAEES